MKLKNIYLLFVLAMFSSCNQISKKDFVGHWYEKGFMSYEVILDSDGTGSAGDPTLLGLFEISWEYRNDSLIITDHLGKSKGYKVVEFTQQKKNNKTIDLLHLSQTITKDNGESYTRKILWEK